MDIKETNWNYVDWIHVAQHRDPVLASCEYGNKLSGSMQAVGCVYLSVSFSSRTLFRGVN